MISRIMLRSTVGLGAFLMMSTSLATAAHAGTATMALLTRLHDKGILSDDDYKQLVAEEQQEQAAPPAPAAAPAPVATTATSSGLDLGNYVKMTKTGIGFDVGSASITFGGSVNGYFVHDSPDKASANTAVAGGIASVGGNNTSAVRNGLLPGYFTISVKTKQAGWDVGAFFGMYPGINSANWGALGANNGGQPTALATAGIDARQTFLTFGKPTVGTFKIGRDIGLFGSDAILNDITLLGSGAPGAGNAAPANTTLGRIGSGYIYTDFQPQMTYTTPAFSGAQLAVGVFQPLESLTGPAQTNSTPGFQAKLTYDAKVEGVAAHLWLSGITQKHDVTVVHDVSYTGRGLDAGAKVTAGPVQVVGYWYTGKGLGTTVFGLFDTDASGNPRSSHGFYIQALGTLGKFSVGGSYGESDLSYANAADALANPTLVKRNSSWVGQGRYALTPWVTLIGEYIHSDAKAHNGNDAKSNALALGGILFF